uniref:Uncharacterized protein n=1 Tax=Anguilla anguilla TaxID=7936 RepID=A0A0E9TB23_ANGAN
MPSMPKIYQNDVAPKKSNIH